MFPGRRLTRWCQLVPRILMIKNGRAMIATTTTTTQQSNNNSNTDLITTTHSMDLVPTLENKDTLIILCDNDASSSGDLGLIFLRVPLKAAGEERMIFDVKTKKVHEEIKAGTRVLATKKEANERTKEMTDAVRNTLLFTVQNRTILERGTDCSCLVFELSGKDRKSGIFARDKLLSIIREQVYEQVCRSLDETAIRMTNEMKAKNFVSDAVTFNQQKKDELFERMFHVLYSETAILDFISQSSSFTEILKSKLLPSSIISPILGTILAKSKNNSKEQQEEKKRKEEMLLPKMSVPRDKLMKQLSDSVDYVKEEMKKRKQEKLLELQRLKNEQQQQQQSKLSSGMMRREDGDTSSLRVKAAAKELYNEDDFSFSSSDSDDNNPNSGFGGSKHAIEMVVNGRKRLLGAHGGIRKEKMIKKYAIEKLKKNLSERGASSSPTTTKNQQQQSSSSFSLLESRERMLMLMRNVEQKKLERKREQQQLEKDLQLMSKVDELLARTEAYDEILDHIIDDDDDDYTKNRNGNDDNEFNEKEQAELEMMIREYDYHDLVVGASPFSSPNVQQQYQEQHEIASPIHGGKGKKKTLLTSTDYDHNEHITMTMKASEDEDIQKCRLQQRMLNLLIIKICSQQVSQQNAREIGEAERRLL